MRGNRRSRCVLATVPAVALMIAAGCEENPTSPLVEQAVFNALGGLEVGQHLTLSGPEAADVLLGSHRVPGEFLLVPFHASQTTSLLRVEITGLSGIGGALEESDGPSTSRGGLDLEPARGPDWGMHERMHERMKAAARPLLRRMRRSPPRNRIATGPRAALSGDDLQVGTLVQLNADAVGPICDRLDLRTGRVEAIGDHSIIVADTANPVGGFTRADYESFASEFDDLVFPVVTEYFGEPTDIDGNGRVIVFFTRAVNELTQPDDDGFIGGFFWVRDLIPRSMGCGASNEAEIFFALAPDPQGLASHIRHTREDVFNDAIATIGHELQHLINASRRFYVNEAEELETTWLDEGLSHVAEEALFYAASGIEPRSNVSLDDLTTEERVDAINRFMVQNLVRYGRYLRETAERSPTGNDDSLETRGAAWSFLRYAADHSGLSDPEFFRRLVDTSESGFDNLRRNLDAAPLDLLQLWGVSIYSDDRVSGVPRSLSQPSWNYRSLLPELFGTFPLQVSRLDPNESIDVSVRAGSSAFIELRGTAGDRSRVETRVGGETPGANFRLTVLRTR